MLLTDFGDFPIAECWHPKRQPVISTVFFVLFVIIAAFIILSLFIGAVCGGMNDALNEFNESDAREKEETMLAIDAKLNPK